MRSPNSTSPFIDICTTVFLSAALTLGCSKKDEPRPAPTALPATPAEQQAPAPLPSVSAEPPDSPPQTGKVTWTAPQSWKTMPARMMRQATYEAEGKAGAAEIGVFYFGPGQGGGIEANIKRWVGQFQDLPKEGVARSEKEVGGLKHTTVEVVRGTFGGGMQMMPNAPSVKKENWGMVATIVETPEGPYFFKMTGPADTVSEQKKQFEALLATVNVK